MFTASADTKLFLQRLKDCIAQVNEQLKELEEKKPDQQVRHSIVPPHMSASILQDYGNIVDESERMLNHGIQMLACLESRTPDSVINPLKQQIKDLTTKLEEAKNNYDKQKKSNETMERVRAERFLRSIKTAAERKAAEVTKDATEEKPRAPSP